MEITETLYVTNREQWRSWLVQNHISAKEIWLIYYRKNTGKPRISYNDAVEIAICYGWIDSTIKLLDNDRTVQRFSPRRKKSELSEMNKERVRRLILSGEMTPFGLEKIIHHFDEDIEMTNRHILKEFKIPKDIIDALKSDPIVWHNFEQFPGHYKIIRTGWIDGARKRPDEFQKRLKYFIKMTMKNKMFGLVQQYLGK